MLVEELTGLLIIELNCPEDVLIYHAGVLSSSNGGKSKCSCEAEPGTVGFQ